MRPEDLRLEARGAGGVMAAEVEVVEPLGSEVFVHWSTGSGAVISRESGESALKPGDRRELHLPMDALHFFDSATGLAIEAS